MASTRRGDVHTNALQFRLDETQNDFDRRFYEAILFRNSDHVDVLRQLVELLAIDGDYQRALELDQRLVALRPNDRYARYNLACSFCMLGNLPAALKALDAALRLGYDDIAHLEADADLDDLRTHPEYFRMLKRHGMAI